MARIDALIHHLFEFGAEAMGVGSGHPVTLLGRGERRSITAAALQPIQVRALLTEIIPADAEAAFDVQNKCTFEYASPSGEVTVEAEMTAAGPRIMIKRAAPKPEPAPPAEIGMEIPTTGVVNLKDLRGPPVPPPVEPPASIEPGRPDIPIPQAGQPCALDPLLRGLVEKKGSDLYVCTGKPPLMRRDGDLVGLGDSPPLTVEQVTQLLYSITPAKMRTAYEETHDVDFAYEIPDVARFRVNLFEDRLGLGGIFRQIPSTVLSAEQLGLSKAILSLCNHPKGLVLVTGPTGSGKSTTLAGMIDYINTTQSKHIITIEDPVEFVHVDKRSVINQREVHVNTESFKRALRAALREDPDIVLVGEMRDLETVAIAIETAETGHLVFGTLHTNTAPSTVDRIIDQFPADEQAQIRTMLASSLIGVVSQTLVKKIGGGRAAAQEVMIVTASVSNLIREAKTFQLPSIMQTGKGVGMVTMTDALFKLVQDKVCTPEEALSKAIKKDEMQAILRRV